MPSSPFAGVDVVSADGLSSKGAVVSGKASFPQARELAVSASKSTTATFGMYVRASLGRFRVTFKKSSSVNVAFSLPSY